MEERGNYKIVLIAAVTKNGDGDFVIGKDGDIPWRGADGMEKIVRFDMNHFKKLTMGHSVIMGRKTYDSIPESYKPLEGRRNIVLSRNNDFNGIYDELRSFTSLNDMVWRFAASKNDGGLIYIGGGQEIYDRTIDMARRLEITEIPGTFEGDSFFPRINSDDWKEVRREAKKAGHSYVTYERK